MPSVASYGYNPIYPVLGTVVGSANSAWRERQFGGPRRIVVAAGLTTLTCFILWVAGFAALSILFGPEAGSSPIESLFESLPPINAVPILLALLILLPIRYYWIQRPALKRERAAFKAHAAAERAARAEAFGR